MEVTTIIGIDCSTDKKKLGLCRASINENRLIIEEVITGARDPIDLMLKWIEGTNALLALDAPLGWPIDLGQLLNSHSAGDPIAILGNQLFRRGTDRFIKRKLGKQSLDVGADRIARTALWTVNFIAALGAQLADPIPLVWSRDFACKVGAIEVYPAATLVSRDLALAGYKRLENIAIREEILTALTTEIDIVCSRAEIVATDDALDSVVCALAGFDFVNGKCFDPEDLSLAKKEGWIWVA